MPKSLIALIVISFFLNQAAHAENLRIDRPPEQTKALGQLVRGPSMQQAARLVFAGMRTPMPRTEFERWRQSYCAPFICNMVLCHGACAAYEEHCPSFEESGRVIKLAPSNCMANNAAVSSN